MFEQKGLKMNIKLLQTLRNYNKDNFIKDIIAGIIIMAVSIPISMGYAQIAGLPAVYGLYGSVFASVYIWCGRGSCSSCRFSAFDT